MPALTPAGLTLTNLPGSPANLARKAALHVHAIVFSTPPRWCVQPCRTHPRWLACWSLHRSHGCRKAGEV